MLDYKGPIEAALSSDLRGEPHNFSLWDIHTGTQLVVFKGNKGNPIAKCIQLVDNNYFITAIDNILYIWSIHNKKCQDQKLFLPGRPSALCISPCTNYLVVAIGETIYVWQIHSGNLLALAQRHYQTVSVLKMNQDGTFLFSAGEDGIVMVWAFADLISGRTYTSSLMRNKNQQLPAPYEPVFTWQHHASQITDLHLTNGGLCLTVSTDSTVNIYKYAESKRLCCATMPSPIWSVVMDKNETQVFIGGQDGNIYLMSVNEIGSCRMNLQNEESCLETRSILRGHKGKVVSMLLTIDGTKLVSASIDASCKVWDLRQKKLLREIKHQAPLANLTSMLIPEAFALSTMTQSLAKPPMSIKALKRNLYKLPQDTTLVGDDVFNDGVTCIINMKNPPNISARFFDSKDSLDVRVGSQNATTESSAETVQSLKQKLREIYKLSAEKIFNDAALDLMKK